MQISSLMIGKLPQGCSPVIVEGIPVSGAHQRVGGRTVTTTNAVVAKINGETTKMLAQPDVRERIAKEGADPLGTTPEQFSVRIKSEIEKWGRVIKDANIKMN